MHECSKRLTERSSFNSLQTGRSFRTMKKVKGTCFGVLLVSIPFKREGLSEPKSLDSAITRVDEFQFPSNGKVFPNDESNKTEVFGLRFQFPSNGKVFPNWSKKDAKHGRWHVFQFPSNGKVFPNFSSTSEGCLQRTCFNSLQTGRSFRT